MEDESDTQTLAGAAYGIFEIILNRELTGRGRYLFERVEAEEDFMEDFGEIFSQFEEEYPQLAQALEDEPGGKDAIYRMLLEGEGVIPSKTTKIYWIVQDSPEFSPEEFDDEKGGKWLIFADKNEADELWTKIRDATVAGRLGISTKISTAKDNPESRDERMVIYVNTPDWEDEEEVMRVREVLKELGVDQRIGYKRNIETYHGEYSEGGKKVTWYSV
ncbi:MAG: DUF1917 domain-containing protein [Methanomicrobiaceae archaeon]|nr:DUF1917 domain-containing protein [Methanomicrobiaceae archaeon]